jgi:hypothetical protein
MRDDPSVRTTLDIEPDVLQAAKEIAQVRGRTTGQVVSECAVAAQGASVGPGRRSTTLGRVREKEIARNGVQRVPLTHRPGAPITTMELVNELRDDE